MIKGLVRGTILRGYAMARAMLFIAASAALLAGCAASTREAATKEAPFTRPSSIRAEAVVDLKLAGSERISGKALVYAVEPDMFRIEALGPFGVTAALLKSDGKTISLAYGGKSEEFSPSDDGRPLPLRPMEFVSLLLGAAPDVESGATRVSSDGATATFSRYRNGVPAFKAVMKGFPRGYGASLPAVLTLTDDKAELTIRYVKTEPDARLEASLFGR